MEQMVKAGIEYEASVTLFKIVDKKIIELPKSRKIKVKIIRK